MSIVRKQTPEEIELERKRLLLAELQARLAERELELATLQATGGAFERRYHRIVGARYVELDRLLAELAGLEAQACPTDRRASERASEAAEQAQQSEREFGEGDDLPARAFQPSDDLKRLYLDLAKRFHPDLVSDEESRARRTVLMAELNRAYAAGDEAAMHALLDRWHDEPGRDNSADIGAALVGRLS